MKFSSIPPGISMAEMANPAATIHNLKVRVAELEAALARVADEPNIDKARAIADAVLSSKR